jgi:DNA polymerase I
MDIENACVPALAWLERTGLPVNDQQWQERAKTERNRKEALTAQLNVMVGRVAPDGKGPYKTEHPVNWNSAKQGLRVLQARGLAVKQTDSEPLSMVADQDPLVPLLLDYREAAKCDGSFGETWLEKHRHPVSGRIHADYLQLESVAGRMSYTKPNVQQMPRSADYRRAIQAPEERVIIKANYSQIELRLAAVIAPDEASLTAFHARTDVHVRTAAMILGLEPAQVTPEQRQLAKALNFGLLYGIREETLRAYAASQSSVPIEPIAAV